MPSVDLRRALTFGRVAEEYARWRPSYPDDAVDWLAPTAPARVADVGAGTGKLTSTLVGRGLIVEAVEPDPQMLAVLARAVPSAIPHECGSDTLPFEDAALDAVLVADAWHWFPVESTMAEARRVLRPGGWLGLVWNLVTPVQPWEFEVAGIDPDQKDTTGRWSPPSVFRPDELEVAEFSWVWEVTPEHYAANLATNSAVIAMTERERAALLDSARTLLHGICDEIDSPTLPFHHAAACLRWTPRA